MAEANSSEENVKIRVARTGGTSQVMIERGPAEGLPAGWIKEVRIKKKNGRVRRDPFYTDPQTGYVFRSLKDSLRYLQTGKPGRYATKPKENTKEVKDENLTQNGNEVEDNEPSSINVGRYAIKPEVKRNELEDDRSSLQESSITHKLEKSETVEQIENAASSKIVNDEHSGAHPKQQERISFTEDVTNHKPSSSSIPDGVEAKPGPKSFRESHGALRNEVIDCLHSTSSERRVTRSQARRNQSKLEKTRETLMPQSPSQQLQGTVPDPSHEMRMIKRARRNMVEQTEEAIPAEPKVDLPSGNRKMSFLSVCVKADSSVSDLKDAITSMGSNKEVQSLYGLAENVEEIGKKNGVSKEKKIWSTGDDDLVVKGGNSQEVETDGNESTSEPPMDLPLEDLWKDPCIAFAIRTLTETSLEDGPCTAEKSSESLRDVAGEKKLDERRSSGVSHGNGPEINSEKTELPFEGIWNDPCIDFAIKTLTGSIPFECDVNLSQVSGENTSQREYLCQQHELARKPVQVFSGKIMMENTGGARCQQQDHKRRNGYPL